MFDNNQILEKWKNYFKDNKKIQKELTKLEKIKVEETNFLNSLSCTSERITSALDIGLNKLNFVTIRALLFTFINENKLNDNDLVFIGSDGSKECVELIKCLSFLDIKKGKLITFEKFEGTDKKLVNETFKKLNIKIGLYIQQSIYDSELFDVFLLDENGDNYTNEYFENIIHIMHQNDYFLVPLLNYENTLFIETPKIIKLFVKKILPLYTKKINTDKTKIAISNHNNNVTEVISKIFGNLDFSYVVNDKVKSFTNIYRKEKIDNSTLKRTFKSEIKFAKRRKANVLISFNNNGSQLFCFIKIRNKFVYLNENLMTLLVLNNFFNEIIVRNKQMPKFYISSSNLLDIPIQNLVKKFNVNFKVLNDSIHDKESYLLYFWNNYNQFAFGEKNNKTFSIYHLMIKLIEIINIYNLQFGGIDSILLDLNHMYSSAAEKKFYLNIQLVKLFDNLNSLNTIDKNILEKKYKLKDVIKINNECENDETTLYMLEFTNSNSLIIKWNNIINKAVLIYRYKENKFKFLNIEKNDKTKYKKIIKLIKN